MATIDGYNSPVDFRITRDPYGVVQDKVIQQNFRDLYDFSFAVITALVQYCGVGTVDSSLWSTFPPRTSITVGNLNKAYVVCGVAIGRGLYVSLTNVAGVLTAVLANANSASGAILQADGWATAAYNPGDIGEFILNTGVRLSGNPVVVAQRYWLGALGVVRTTPLVTAGNLEQYLGIAVGTNALFTALGPAIQH